MNRTASCLAILALCACKAPTDELSETVVRLTGTGSRLQLEIAGAQQPVAAIEVELLVDSGAAYLVEDAAAPPGVAIDTVRARMRGTNRAILFASDTRGLHMSPDGAVAAFSVQAVSEPAPARISIGRLLVVGPDGQIIPARAEAALSFR